MIEVTITMPLNFDDQETMKKLYVTHGDGLDFKSFCEKFLRQELRWALDKGFKNAEI